MFLLWRILLPYVLFYFLTQTGVRISLLIRSLSDVDFSVGEVAQIMLRGLWFDAVTAGFVLIPMMLLLLFTRRNFWTKPAGKITQHIAGFVFVFSVIFGMVAEHLFWSEFTTRFNFIAVDYLVYTQEVIGNITESYPLGWLLSAIAVAAAAIVWFLSRFLTLPALPVFSKRLMGFAGAMVVCLTFYSASNIGQAQFDNNTEAGELAANGTYNLFYAFWHNEIDYERFYAQQPAEQVDKNIRKLLADKTTPFDGDSLIRDIIPAGKEQHKNVMIVVMESMSAAYMGAYGNEQNLTPNLDRLAKDGLFFSQLYATGTRTVRGLEAVTLSIPPTPGQSIIRRIGNDNLFSLGFVFKDRGYDTAFIYGGYGYFDNMNNFFAGNGFDIIDRNSMAADEINFANVWGVVDDDMFMRAIKEADKSTLAGKPFAQVIMTTTNHRPYTYPNGRIDIPSKSNRLGGVKYADYSVGVLMEEARKKPWFKDTIFIFVADHTAGASGKAELDPKKYHIPMIFYAPDLIKPQRYEKIASQIDLAPTLLGLLNFHYRSKFYGEDVLRQGDKTPRTFVSNYQKVALAKNGVITVLSPKRGVTQLGWKDLNLLEQVNQTGMDDTMAYFQSASKWREHFKRIPTVIKTP